MKDLKADEPPGFPVELREIISAAASSGFFIAHIFRMTAGGIKNDVS